MTLFKAMQVTESSSGSFSRKIIETNTDALPPGDVLIKVKYSSLNYKDALSATGNKGVTRKYPFTPGIDAAGEVAESSVKEFTTGQEVLVTGFDLGMNTHGGFGEYIRVPAGWVVPVPFGLSIRRAMILGTAGFTAALAVHHLLHNGMTSDKGKVLVTGATGGVGSLAVRLLDHLGFEVIAASRKSRDEYLQAIGASEILDSDTLKDESKKGLLSARWAHAVDTVGGDILSTVIRSTAPHGNVASCGLANSAELPLTVFPFIIRGVNLLGVNSAETPYQLRKAIWGNLASVWRMDVPDMMVKEIPLKDVDDYISKILKGKITGRVLIRI